MNMFVPPVLLADIWQFVFGILMFLSSIFLILLILVQRGRGGGLAGAFGGMGGQSAFGTKAGDLFTRITMIAAAFWILLCIMSILVLNRNASLFPEPLGAGSAFESAPVDLIPSESEGEDTSSSSLAPAGGGLDAGATPVEKSSEFGDNSDADNE